MDLHLAVIAMSRIVKSLKWGASALRVARLCIVYGGRLKISLGKPLYIGRGARVILGADATLSVGSGVYLSPGCVVQVNDGARLMLEDGVYMNENCRVTVVESTRIGSDTIFGPNVQVYDHDHQFDRWGVRSELLHAPVSIGQHCWLCANAVVTRGCAIADRSLISANSVVTHDLPVEGALYCGSPARLIKKYKNREK